MNESTNQRINESTRSRAPWLMVVAIVGFALIMFRQVLIPGYCLFTTDDNMGAIRLGKDCLRIFNGYWNDIVICGLPSGIVPIAWNALLIWLLPITCYINWIHALELVIASLFFMLFLRCQHITWPAMALGILGALWVGSNLTLAYAGHVGKFGVVMMAAIALFCVRHALFPKTNVLWGYLAGGAIGFMFLEQLDVALFFGFVLGAYALFLAIRQWQANGVWLKSVVALILMGGVGLMLSASTMFSSYTANVKGAVSMQTESPREKWDYVTQWSWPPEECIDFIAPGYMGWRSSEPAGPYWGRMGRSPGWEQTRQGFMNFKLENQYLGIIPILLAVFAVLMAIMGKGSWFTVDVPDAVGNSGSIPGMVRRPVSGVWCPFAAERRAEILFWACVAVITLLLAFGKFFPLYALFYKLPLISSIRNPNKFLQIFQLALGILAAYGLDEVLRSKRPTSNAQRPMSDERPRIRHQMTDTGRQTTNTVDCGL
ncbi:MAG: hypothetical protein KJ964_07310 [Verrucomicrobia bacterium]|nr:hypothetical protein [Verrucomicrobiota bacterium]MBU1735464.1 hypothetical protein [Verrucomicrobiota bacterium]MBU1856859.1 hypothetical protein [Verrucomicrobiota bacterium]